MPSNNDSSASTEGDLAPPPVTKRRISPVPRWAGVMAAILIVSAGGYYALHRFSPPPKIGGPFTLTAVTGGRVSDTDFRGKWILIYFGYTFCPDACPLALSNITEAMSELGPKADLVQPVFITVDPDRDTSKVLADFTSNFDSRIVALTGTPAEITDVEREFRVYAAKVPDEKNSGNYLMDHTSLFYLVDPNGHYAGIMQASVEGPKLAAALTADLERNL
jgi:protein SCO1/2